MNDTNISKNTILLIEDEENIRTFISTTLKNQGYKITSASNGKDGMHLAASLCPDIVLLDLGLPDLDGMDVIKQLRAWSAVPIIVISARTNEHEKAKALDCGADDYITKPFKLGVLVSRVNALLRRAKDFSATDTELQSNGIKVLLLQGQAFKNGELLDLTAAEYKLLCLLSKNVGKVLTHTYITQQIWGSSWENDIASLRVFMATLRKKLEPQKDSPQYIQTHIGVGYRMLRVD